MTTRNIVTSFVILALAATVHAQTPEVIEFGTSGKVRVFKSKNPMTDEDPCCAMSTNACGHSSNVHFAGFQDNK